MRDKCYKINIYFLIILFLLFFLVGDCLSQSPKPFIYGVSTPRFYGLTTFGDWTSYTTYYASLPTLTANDTLMTLATDQTVTGTKTITSPVLTSPSITSPTISGTAVLSSAILSGIVDASDGVYSRSYHWIEEFDDEAAAVQLENGLNADFWTTAGDNYAAAQVVYANVPGGGITMTPDGTDDSSNNILGLPHWRTDNNPIIETIFKVDDTSNCFVGVGFTTEQIASFASPTDDMVFVYFNNDPDTSDGLSLRLWCSDNNTDVSDDLGVDVTDDTYVKCKIDCTDTEQPRVWVDNTEISASAITGTIQAGRTLYPFALIEDLAADAPVLTLKKIEGWQAE